MLIPAPELGAVKLGELDNMDKDELRYAPIEKLLVTGPVGNRRHWAGNLVLQMLDRLSHPAYRHDDRFTGQTYRQAAINSLRAAASVMTPSEQGLFVLAAIFTTWIELSRNTGLTVKMRDAIDALAEEVGKSACIAAARSVLDHGEVAVRRYKLDGLFPEKRKPGEGIILSFSPEQARRLGLSSCMFEFDRLVATSESFERYGWEVNLRPLTTWWLENSEQPQVDREVNLLVAKMSKKSLTDADIWRALGLMDWLTNNPDHNRAQDAVKAAVRIKHAPLRKSAAKLAALTKSWDLIESLAQRDPDRGVRKLAEQLLANKGPSETPPANEEPLE